MKKLAGKLYSESYKAESRELKWAKNCLNCGRKLYFTQLKNEIKKNNTLSPKMSQKLGFRTSVAAAFLNWLVGSLFVRW